MLDRKLYHVYDCFKTMVSPERQRRSKEGQGEGNLVKINPRLAYVWKGNAGIEANDPLRVYVGDDSTRKFFKGDARQELGSQPTSIYPQGGFKEGRFKGDAREKMDKKRFAT